MASTKMHQAKLGGVRVFRLFLDDEFPQEIRDHLFEHGNFLFNLKPYGYDQTVGVPPLCSAQFKLSALRKGDFFNLARFAVSSMGEVIAPTSRKSMAQKISDYMKSCFKFHGPTNKNVFLPRLVFVVDVFVDPENCEEEDNYDGETYEDDNNQYKDNNYNVHDALISSLGAEKYGSLKGDDIEVLQSWYTKFMEDIAKSDAVEPKSNCTKISQYKVQNTFKMIIPTLQPIQSKNFGEDVMCSLCLDKMSTEEENTMLVRCKHVFHSDCLFKWLPNKRICPHCSRSSLTDLWV